MFLQQQSFDPVLGLPYWFWYIFIFALGAIIGSFLNVVIHRVPREESVVMPNSACPNCKKKIGALDNIPIISWLLLKGKCRNCQEPIAWRYPAVEASDGSDFRAGFLEHRIHNLPSDKPYLRSCDDIACVHRCGTHDTSQRNHLPFVRRSHFTPNRFTTCEFC